MAIIRHNSPAIVYTAPVSRQQKIATERATMAELDKASRKAARQQGGKVILTADGTHSRQSKQYLSATK